MDLQQVYAYEFRFVREALQRRAGDEPRFFIGVLYGVAFSIPLWMLIIWAVKALIA